MQKVGDVKWKKIPDWHIEERVAFVQLWTHLDDPRDREQMAVALNARPHPLVGKQATAKQADVEQKYESLVQDLRRKQADWTELMNTFAGRMAMPCVVVLCHFGFLVGAKTEKDPQSGRVRWVRVDRSFGYVQDGKTFEFVPSGVTFQDSDKSKRISRNNVVALRVNSSPEKNVVHFNSCVDHTVEAGVRLHTILPLEFLFDERNVPVYALRTSYHNHPSHGSNTDLYMQASFALLRDMQPSHNVGPISLQISCSGGRFLEKKLDCYVLLIRPQLNVCEVANAAADKMVEITRTDVLEGALHSVRFDAIQLGSEACLHMCCVQGQTGTITVQLCNKRDKVLSTGTVTYSALAAPTEPCRVAMSCMGVVEIALTRLVL